MKKLILAIVLLTSVCFYNTSVYAQKKFKGIVTYTITYGGTIDPATAAQQPKMVTVAIFENKQKMTIPMGPVTIDVITDGDNKTSTTLLDIMGQKVYYKMSTEEIEAQLKEGNPPTINYFEETKNIAGYACKKAEYIETNEDGEATKTVVYFTDALGGEALNYGGQFNGLKGFPLEYTITTSDGIISTFTATEVKKGKVKETDFLIPADYTELSADQKKELMEQLKGNK